MKVFGVVSKNNYSERAIEKSAKLLHRQPKEQMRKFKREDTIIYLIVHDKEYITSNEFKIAVNDRNGEQFRFCEINERLRTVQNDKMRISKLYYYNNGNEFVFSSEIKAIVNYIGRIHLTINHAFIDNMIVYGFPYLDITLFNEIKNLRPEHRIVHEGLEVRTEKIIPIREYVFDRKNKHDRQMLFQFLKDKTVPHELIQEHSFLWFSGGLDSRILFKLLSDARTINTIVNFGYEGTKERKYAKKYAHKNYIVNLTNYEITPEIILENYKEHMWINEGFSGHLNAHIYGFLKKFKNTANLVIYDGYAGGITLGGIGYKKGSPRWDMKPCVNAPFFMRDVYWIPDEEQIHNYYMRNITANGGIKIGREFGTVIYPFADYNFFKWCMQVPIEERRKHKFYKKILRESLPDILKSPSTTIEGQSLFHRAKNKLARKLGIYKQGYVQPERWLRDSHDYRAEIYDTLFSDECLERDYFNHKKIKHLYKKHLRKEGNYADILVRLFNLEVMFQQFLDGDGFDVL